MKKTIALLATALTIGSFSTPAQAGNDSWIGEITTVGFSLLGTVYGGDGRTTFALPDMRGRTGIHTGSGPGLTDRRLGSKGGAESVTLTVNQMPAHTHSAASTSRASNLPADSADPTGNVNALDVGGNTYHTGGGTVDMASGSVTTTIGSAGGSQAHQNMQPYLTLTYCIATVGTYPSRN